MSSKMQNLIPTNGGSNPVNGLKIQNTVCIVFNYETLEILATAGTHNQACELSTHIYNEKKIDARSDAIRFHSEDINAIDLIGMKCNQFQHFVENNPNHPLCIN